MVVQNPIKITITNLEEGYEEMLVVENNPEDLSAGSREMVFPKTVFIEREISRLGDIKGSEDVLTKAIEMAREGSTREEIINNTGLRLSLIHI